jgi:hypothetical protein
MFFLRLFFVLYLMVVFFAGCSVSRALNQPDKKDLSVLQAGVSRHRVIAELGYPRFTEEKDGKKVDIFTFVQGYSKGAKTGRALAHGTADFFTLGLWELVGTPIEGAASGTEVQVKVTYDDQDRVASTEAFRGGHKIDRATKKE